MTTETNFLKDLKRVLVCWFRLFVSFACDSVGVESDMFRCLIYGAFLCLPFVVVYEVVFCSGDFDALKSFFLVVFLAFFVSCEYRRWKLFKQKKHSK